MIWESGLWREELRKIASKMTQRLNQRRWVERSLVNVEKDIFIGFYIIRKLREARKLHPLSSKRLIRLFAYPSKGQVVHLMNWHRLDELYDFTKKVSLKKDLIFICNQIIHSYIFTTCHSNNEGLEGILFSSDYERIKFVYELTLKQIIIIFQHIANSEPTGVLFKFDAKKGDFDYYI